MSETPAPEFVALPKIPRLFRECVITEKIDGSNAQLLITEDGDLFAGSRNRWLTPGANDNFGFAAWVFSRPDELVSALGVGRHYGEWYGSGIQRGYGLLNGERRFALFNSSRWAGVELPAGVEVVPGLYAGAFDTRAIRRTMTVLWSEGSRVASASGFPNPEGVIVYHVAARQSFKVLLEGDETPKGNV